MRTSDHVLELPYLEVGGELNLCFINVPEQVAREGGWLALSARGRWSDRTSSRPLRLGVVGRRPLEIIPQGVLCGD